MGRSLDKVSRKKSYDRKDSRVKRGLGRRGLSRRRKQRGGAAKTPEVDTELLKIKALLADTTSKSATDIGNEATAAQTAAQTAATNAGSGTIDKDDQTIIDEINKINTNIKTVVDFLKTTPTQGQTALGTEQEVKAYAALYSIETKVKDTNLFKDLQKIYTNLKEDGTVPVVTSSASSASTAVAASTVDPKTLPGLTHIAVFVPITTNATGAYEVKSDPSPYAYYVSDTGTATTGTSNSIAGLVSIDATTSAKTVTKCDDVTTWSTHP